MTVTIYKTTQDGTKEYNGHFDTAGKTVSKTITTMDGNGEWRYLHGIKLLIGPSENVIKGPMGLIGRQWDDLVNLNYQDIFGYVRSIARALAITNKSQVTLEDEQEAKDIIIKANDVLQTKINILNK